jgi:transketolase
MQDVPYEAGMPSCLIAHTHKGNGVSFMRDQVGWHHRIPTDDELEQALLELEGAER